MVGAVSVGSGQAGYVSPLLPCTPAPGRVLAAASGSPCRGCRRRQRPRLTWPCLPSHCQVFTCSLCQESFRRRMELRLHMVSHTGEMPYKVSSAVPGVPPPWPPWPLPGEGSCVLSVVAVKQLPSLSIHGPPHLWSGHWLQPCLQAVWGVLSASLEGRSACPWVWPG